MEMIALKFDLDRTGATQKFLEIIKNSRCSNEWLVFDLADILGISQDELLNDTTLQIQTLKRL
jgi:hypothetical protein